MRNPKFVQGPTCLQLNSQLSCPVDVRLQHTETWTIFATGVNPANDVNAMDTMNSAIIFTVGTNAAGRVDLSVFFFFF